MGRTPDTWHSAHFPRTKTAAFVHTENKELMPTARRGATSLTLGHITDVFPTFLNLAGGDASPTSTGPLDGYDMWDAWVKGAPSPRNEIIYNADPVGLAFATSALVTTLGRTPGAGGSKNRGDPSISRKVLNGNMPETYQAIRVGRWKLIDGYPGRGDWFGTDPGLFWKASADYPANEHYIMGLDAADYDLIERGGPHGDMQLGDGGQAAFARSGQQDYDKLIKTLWLFDLENDPTERHDLSAQMPEKVEEMRQHAKRLLEPFARPLLLAPVGVSPEDVKQEQLKYRSMFANTQEFGRIIEWWSDSPELQKIRQGGGGATERSKL